MSLPESLKISYGGLTFTGVFKTIDAALEGQPLPSISVPARTSPPLKTRINAIQGTQFPLPRFDIFLSFPRFKGTAGHSSCGHFAIRAYHAVLLSRVIKAARHFERNAHRIGY